VIRLKIQKDLNCYKWVVIKCHGQCPVLRYNDSGLELLQFSDCMVIIYKLDVVVSVACLDVP
jgi:hypothetical protein